MVMIQRFQRAGFWEDGKYFPFPSSLRLRISGHFSKLRFCYCDIFTNYINFYLADTQLVTPSYLYYYIYILYI